MDKSPDNSGWGLILGLLAVFGFACFISYMAGAARGASDTRAELAKPIPDFTPISPREAACDAIFDQVDAVRQAEALHDQQDMSETADRLNPN